MKLFGKTEEECSIEELEKAFNEHGIMTSRFNVYMDKEREKEMEDCPVDFDTNIW